MDQEVEGNRKVTGNMSDESNRFLSATPTNDKLSVVNDEDDDGAFNSSSAGGEGGTTKAKITRKRYTREMIVTLLEIVDEILPYGNKDWEAVAVKYNAIYADDRDYVSVRKKFFDLVPRGNIPLQLQSAENLRADLVSKRINLRQHTGVMPPPTPSDVLISLYNNSNLPLPSYLHSLSGGDGTTASNGRLSSPDSNMVVSVSAQLTTSAPTTTASVLGKRKGNSATSDSLLNLVNAGNGSSAGGNGNGAAPGNSYAAAAASSYVASASSRNEDFLQYSANPQSYRPSPFGAGLSTILSKILVEPSLRNTSPTVVPPLHQQKLDQMSSPDVAPNSLASLAGKRARQGGVLMTELGKLEDILLDVYSAHDKLAIYFAQKLPETPESTPENGLDDSKDSAVEELSTAAKDAELAEMEKIYASSVQCVQQVAQWLEVYRPQFRKLKLTPYHLLKMKRSLANMNSSGNNNNIGNEDKELASSTPKKIGEGDLEDVDDKGDDDEDEDDGAADDFEDLYDGEKQSVNNSTVMDTD